MKKPFFIYQIAKSTAYYAAYYALCERAFTLNCIEKTEIEIKEAGYGPFTKVEKYFLEKIFKLIFPVACRCCSGLLPTTCRWNQKRSADPATNYNDN